jgi:hypothetical protein
LLQTESVCLFATDSALVAGSNRCQVSYGNSMVAATRPPPDKIGVAIAALPHSNLFRDVATCVNLITESFGAERRAGYWYAV